MNKLTTDRLEKFVNDIKTDGMCDITDSQVQLALIRLLAYEQAAKNEVALPEALKYAEIYGRAFICVDRSGSVHAVDPSQITLSILKEPAPAQPVIPGQLTLRMAEEKALSLGAVLYDEEAEVFADGWNACRAEMLKNGKSASTELPNHSNLSTNSPVIPDGWKLVPIEPTENMIIDGFESEPDKTFSKPEVWEEYAAMSGCKQAAHRAKLCWAAMLAAAPTPQKGE